MHALGVPTTRALAAISTGEVVYRENPLPGAILTRVAASHIRIGTFQFFAARGATDKVRELADYTIARHYPENAEAENPYLEFFASVTEAQAALVAQWMNLGFIHGVMNTDNMAISGETIDYGPCAFLDTYSADTAFSSIDTQGRYAYGNQPLILSRIKPYSDKINGTVGQLIVVVLGVAKRFTGPSIFGAIKRSAEWVNTVKLRR